MNEQKQNDPEYCQYLKCGEYEAERHSSIHLDVIPGEKCQFSEVNERTRRKRTPDGTSR
jgi:uncharacterized protein (DUF779 family)